MSLPFSGERDSLEIYVALDLETTGLSPERDEIIEVGAVKFQGERVLEALQTLVNPYRLLPPFIRRFTGITQGEVDGAPPFAVVAGELAEFIGAHPLIGHNIAFDLAFLSRHGLPLNNTAHDTWDLGAILLPRASDYSLGRLARELGIEHPRPHRALPDAQVTHRVFLALLERAQGLDPGILSGMYRLAMRSQAPLRHLLGRLEERAGVAAWATVGLLGLDVAAMGRRLAARRSISTRKVIEPLDVKQLAALLSPGGLLSRAFPHYEHRPQQVEMAQAVAQAVNEGHHLIVEGGTGIGKSLAYLLPAILFSVKSGRRVVVSTNTINLQEQLLGKDIPALVKVLEEGGVIPRGEFRAAPLKGRANYLCLRRWGHLARSESLTAGEARLLSKTLVWLQDTLTADRGEINLAGRDAALWQRISAGEKGYCPGSPEGPCFLRAARERAEGAHVLVVNHALLLSDLARGGNLLPDYRYLVIDEAHHLEEEATRQMGFQLSQGQLGEELDTVTRLLEHGRNLLRGSLVSQVQRQRQEELIAQWERHLPHLREAWGRLWGLLSQFAREHRGEGEERLQLRVTPGTRAQPAWSEVEIAWENADLALAEGIRPVERFHQLLEGLSVEAPVDYSTVVLELANGLEALEELRDRLKLVLAAPEEERIYWVDQEESDGSLVLHSAPLNVGPELEKRLFSHKECVILTSATLTTQGSFAHIRERVGLSEGEELLVGSPFDYRRAALLLIPQDMPEPDAPEYPKALEAALVGLGEALAGRTLALFTSHSALQGARRAIQGPLEAEGVQVLAQGVDGTPKQLVESFTQNPQSLLLGTSSFWEGVDLAGGILKALVVARLPFHVPTEPVFAARSQLYEDPFSQYALPQAVLRFRQGFGRLIRGRDDRGIVVVLDRRILSRNYGSAFLNSIPPCTVKKVPLGTLGRYAREWLRS